MGDRRGQLDERFLLTLVTLMLALVIFRWISHLFGR